jgi:hypothetical protein
MRKLFVVELRDCVENDLIGVKKGTSYVQVYGRDVLQVKEKVNNIVNFNSESNGVGRVNVIDRLPEGESIDQNWSAYLEIKNPKFFEESLQD